MPLNKLIQSYDKGQIQELYNTIYLTMYLNCKCNDKGYAETESKNIAKKIWSIESDWKRATLLKLTLIHGCFSWFLNCTNGTKSRNAPHNI